MSVSCILKITVLAPLLGPVFAAIERPIAKSPLKGGLMLYEKGREATAVAGDTVKDMVAEIRAEGGAQPAATGLSAPPAPSPGTDLPTEARRGGRPEISAV